MDGSADVDAVDGDLWRRAARGDSVAFGVLFERHVDTVYTHCFRRTASWSDAEDLVSVVFLEAWRRCSEVGLDGGSVPPWLLAVANNVLRNHDRSVRRNRRLVAKLSVLDRRRDEIGDLTERLGDEQRMRGVLAVVEQLPEAEQDVLALCAWAGLSYADAAEALGVPIGTVRSRLSRARADLHRRTADPAPSAPRMTKGDTHR
ncbi:MAG: RNA polymerase subunit sigma-70 [Pseudonocardiales bacterium]|nr:MAG: RNA polymerase subunit sigma-70 [Pseudonocardiales bacterium]